MPVKSEISARLKMIKYRPAVSFVGASVFIKRAKFFAEGQSRSQSNIGNLLRITVNVV